MKTLKLIIAILLISITTVNAQKSKSLQWIGGPTYLIHLGSFKILTDPMLSPKGDSAFIIKQHPTTGQLNAPITRLIAPAKFDMNNIDVLLISHPHADHVDKQAVATLPKNLHVVGPQVNKQVFDDWGWTTFTGLNWGDSAVIKKANETLSITAVEAHHAANDPLKTQLGKGNGYIITYTNGNDTYRIYWTGDTVWFDDLATYTKYGKIDLLVPDMGSVGSDGAIGRRGLNAADCLQIAKTLNPQMIIPVHHSTFSMYVEPISVLKDTLSKTEFGKRLHILKTGQTAKL